MGGKVDWGSPIKTPPDRGGRKKLNKFLPIYLWSKSELVLGMARVGVGSRESEGVGVIRPLVEVRPGDVLYGPCGDDLDMTTLILVDGRHAGEL